jgi:hypothetical protein
VAIVLAASTAMATAAASIQSPVISTTTGTMITPKK